MFEPQPKSKKLALKKALTDWSLACTFHCYPKIFQYESRLAQALWSVMFLLFSGMTSFLVIQGMQDYFDYEVVSQIRILNAAEFTFPTVTICDSSPFTSKQAENFLRDTWQEVSGLDVDQTPAETFLAQVNIVREFGKQKAASPVYNDSYKQSLGSLFRSNVKSCIFNQLNCHLTRDIRWIYLYEFGNCLQYNSGYDDWGNVVSLKATTFQSQKYGLQLQIGNLTDENERFLRSDRSLKVFIHEQSQVPQYFDSAFSVELKKQTNIGLKRTESFDEPRPYSECQNLTKLDLESDLVQAVRRSGVAYRQTECFTMAFQRKVVQNCGCYFTGVNAVDQVTRPCLRWDQFGCFLREFYDFQAKTSEFKGKWSLECPLECDLVTFDFEVSFSDYSPQYIAYQRKYNLTQNMLTGEFSLLSVFYPSMQYTEITQTPKTSLIDLISNLGGSIGIFLGFSIFSLIEIVEIFIRMLYILCHRSRVEDQSRKILSENK